MKWLLSLSVGTNRQTLGYMDSKFAEFIQVFHHLLHGTYLAYSRPSLMRRFQIFFPLAPFNRGLRKALGAWLKKPSSWLKPLYLQAMMIIQPIDILEDGRQNMCDACPDIIPYGERLVWSCRLDELQKLGGFLECAPKNS
jgi:hypothetical protein